MTTWLTFAIALGASLILTKAARSMAARFDAVDCPDGQRKLHQRPIPLWGGVAVFLALVIGLFVTWRGLDAAGIPFLHLSGTLLLSAGCVFLLGFIDDSVDLPGRIKLLLQVVSVLPILLSGHWFDRIVIFGHVIELGYLGLPLMMLWLVGCINALNLLDGMDGNASVVGLVACAAIAMIGWKHGQDHAAVMAITMAGAILGFLFFNLPSASIYLGDCGSTVIGLVAGFLCIEASYVPTGELRVAVPIVIMTLPILDTTLAVVRRRLTGRRFDSADRGHIHHRLLERGFNAWQALAIIAGLCLATAAAAVAAIWTDCEPLAWATSLLLIVAMTHLRYFGHHEFSLASVRVARAANAIGEQIWILAHPAQRTIARQLPQLSFDEAWQTLTSEIAPWPARQLELRLKYGDELRVSQVWTNPSTTLPDGFQWRLLLTFGPRDGIRCELLVLGQDTLTAQPRYLNRIAAVLRIFGRFWASHPECISVPHLRIFAAQESPRVWSDYRKAA